MPNFKPQKIKLTSICQYLAGPAKLRTPPESKGQAYKNCVILVLVPVLHRRILKPYHHEVLSLKIRGFIMPGKSCLIRVYT